MNTMTYRNYAARIEFDERDNIFVGRLQGISDIVSFHASTVPDLRAAFEEAVDDYIETCARIGRPAEKPASGRLMLRVDPAVHAAALNAASQAGQSLNKWAEHVLKDAAHA
jgi:predicted HicB family RNase H-like nuclease